MQSSYIVQNAYKLKKNINKYIPLKVLFVVWYVIFMATDTRSDVAYNEQKYEKEKHINKIKHIVCYDNEILTEENSKL